MMLKLFDQAVPSSLRTLRGKRLTTLLCGGIVNPAGPILRCVSLLGDAEESWQVDLVQIMLNPFSQGVHRIGRATIEDTPNAVIDYEPLFCRDFGSCPTLLLPSALLDPEPAVLIHSRWLDTFESAAWTWQRIQQHPFDPWTRIKEDIPASVLGFGFRSREAEMEPSHSKRETSGFRALDFARFALKVWTLQEYALEIAPRLYRLEQIETSPRIFPVVLQLFGLEPRSPSSEWAETPDHGVPTASV